VIRVQRGKNGAITGAVSVLDEGDDEPSMTPETDYEQG